MEEKKNQNRIRTQLKHCRRLLKKLTHSTPLSKSKGADFEGEEACKEIR